MRPNRTVIRDMDIGMSPGQGPGFSSPSGDTGTILPSIETCRRGEIGVVLLLLNPLVHGFFQDGPIIVVLHPKGGPGRAIG